MTEGAVGTPVADEAIVVAETTCCVAMQVPPGATMVEWGRSPMALHTGCPSMADTTSIGIEACHSSVGADSEKRGVATR
jgi:hypothetical protein